MKTRKQDTLSKKSVLNKTVNSKPKISRPKAGASLEKAVKNVKQIFKKKVEDNVAKKKKTRLRKPKQFKARKSVQRGIVYIGHLPHGFYEEQMKNYFKQFGKVTRVRVSRSKRSGRSCGYGYVEFLFPEVAKVAAESMNNYLMCGRLLKATYIPPEKQHPGFFLGRNWSEDKYPKLKNRKKATLSRNSVQNAENNEKYINRSLKKLSTLENKLQRKGISIKFQPVDAPKT